MSIGIVIPGISSTLILMLLGIYHSYLAAISSLSFSFLIPLAIGVILGSLVCMGIIKTLLKKYYPQTFFSIVGFTAGSIFVLFPSFNSILDVIISVLCVILGFYIISMLENRTFVDN